MPHGKSTHVARNRPSESNIVPIEPTSTTILMESSQPDGSVVEGTAANSSRGETTERVVDQLRAAIFDFERQCSVHLKRYVVSVDALIP